MKSIEDYVNLEPQFYQDVLDHYQELFVSRFAEEELNHFDNIIIYATGSSSNAAYGALPFMSKVLEMPVQIAEPSIAENYLLNVKPTTLCLAISQGGHSYSIVELIERLQDRGRKVYALTSDMNSPVAKISKNLLAMGMPVEEMPYVSAGYSVEILDLILLALTIAKATGKLTVENYQQYLEKIKIIIQEMPNVIAASSSWVQQHLGDFAAAKRLIFIGYGSAYGISREGETKITETVRISSWGKELEEYMHGPYLGLMKNDFVICLEPNGKLQKREELLKQFLNAHVDHVYAIYANDGPDSKDHDLSLKIKTDELLASLFMTVPIHLLAYHLSQKKENDLQHSAYPDFDKITASKI